MTDEEKHIEVTHACPVGSSGLMLCCGRTPFEVPISDRMTLDQRLITCGVPDKRPGNVVTDRCVHKFPLYRAATHMLVIGLCSRIPVLVAMQNGVPTVWLEVDRGSTAEETILYLVLGTGQQVPAGAVHRGSVLDREFVWHVYELPDPPPAAGRVVAEVSEWSEKPGEPGVFRPPSPAVVRAGDTLTITPQLVDVVALPWAEVTVGRGAAELDVAEGPGLVFTWFSTGPPPA